MSRKHRPGELLKVIVLGHSPCSWNVVQESGFRVSVATTGGNTILLLGLEEREKTSRQIISCRKRVLKMERESNWSLTDSSGAWSGGKDLEGADRKTNNEEPQAVFCRAKDLDQSCPRARIGLGWVQRPGLRLSWRKSGVQSRRRALFFLRQEQLACTTFGPSCHRVWPGQVGPGIGHSRPWTRRRSLGILTDCWEQLADEFSLDPEKRGVWHVIKDQLGLLFSPLWIRQGLTSNYWRFGISKGTKNPRRLTGMLPALSPLRVFASGSSPLLSWVMGREDRGGSQTL